MRIAPVIVILLLLFGGRVYAESQPPSPSTSKADTHQVKNTDHPQNTPTGLPQPASEIRTSTSVLAKLESQPTKDQKTDQSPSDWCLVILTAVLAFATYRLVVQTRRLVNETAIASKRQATETQSALQLSLRAAAAAEKAAELAQISFLAANQPRIILRDAYCTSVEIGDPIEVHYVLANSGESAGTIIGSILCINKYLESSCFGAFVLPKADEGTNQIGEITIQPGEQRTYIFTSDDIRWQTYNMTRHDSPDESIGVFFSGHIVYKDDRGVIRNMAFHRRHKIGPERFFKSEDRYICALEYE